MAVLYTRDEKNSELALKGLYDIQKEYKIISFGNLLEDYSDIIGKNYEVEKIGLKEYLIKK